MCLHRVIRATLVGVLCLAFAISLYCPRQVDANPTPCLYSCLYKGVWASQARSDGIWLGTFAYFIRNEDLSYSQAKQAWAPITVVTSTGCQSGSTGQTGKFLYEESLGARVCTLDFDALYEAAYTGAASAPQFHGSQLECGH